MALITPPAYRPKRGATRQRPSRLMEEERDRRRHSKKATIANEVVEGDEVLVMTLTYIENESHYN